MEIYLHLGAHRCANQTFHSFLNTASSELLDQGVTVWTPRRTRDGLLRGLTRAPELITLEDERQGVRSIGRIRLELERLERAGQRALLVSDVDLLGEMPQNLDQTALYPLLKERLMRLMPAFADRSLRIGLSVRSLEDYWTSALASGLSQGRPTPTTDMLDLLTTQPRQWRHVICDVAASFPHARVFVWPFERLLGRSDDILRIVSGHSWPNLPAGQDWFGRSGDLSQLNVLMAASGRTALGGDDARAGGDSGTRWMPFDAEHCRLLRAEYRRDLAWLQAGAQGLATYIDGRKPPAFWSENRDQTDDDVGLSLNTDIRGLTDGIEKKLG